jgi:guanylate kinase
MERIKGHLVLLMAPSGSGKNAVMQGLAELREQLYFAKTLTSRQRRVDTEENPNYVFVNREEYEAMIEAGAILEWAEFGGNLYGTPKAEVLGPLLKPQVVFKEMDLQGVLQMKRIIPDDHLTIVYIDAGGWPELEARIQARAEISSEELAMRKARYEVEIAARGEAEIIISNRNGELQTAQDNFKNLIAGIIARVHN